MIPDMDGHASIGILERVFRLAVWGNRLGNGKVELGGYPRVGGEDGGG